MSDDHLLMCCCCRAACQHIVEEKDAEIASLREAIRRLAEQDAMLSLLCKRDGSQVVTVTMDATLTDEEREAVAQAIGWIESPGVEDEAMPEDYLPITATLRKLLERLK